MTGADVSIAIDPKARIQGLLEANNRYLERARAAEAALAITRLLLSNYKGALEDLRGVIDESPASSATLALVRGLLSEIIDATDYIPSRPARGA